MTSHNPCSHNTLPRAVGVKYREPLDHIMEELATSQAGVGALKCSYCAYERGHSDGVTAGRAEVRERLSEFSG